MNIRYDVIYASSCLDCPFSKWDRIDEWTCTHPKVNILFIHKERIEQSFHEECPLKIMLKE